MANVTINNNLQIKNSDFAKEWHPTKNRGLTPFDVPAGTNKKVWWICKKVTNGKLILTVEIEDQVVQYVGPDTQNWN